MNTPLSSSWLRIAWRTVLFTTACAIDPAVLEMDQADTPTRDFWAEIDAALNQAAAQSSSGIPSVGDDEELSIGPMEEERKDQDTDDTMRPSRFLLDTFMTPTTGNTEALLATKVPRAYVEELYYNYKNGQQVELPSHRNIAKEYLTQRGVCLEALDEKECDKLLDRERTRVKRLLCNLERHYAIAALIQKEQRDNPLSDKQIYEELIQERKKYFSAAKYEHAKKIASDREIMRLPDADSRKAMYDRGEAPRIAAVVAHFLNPTHVEKDSKTSQRHVGSAAAQYGFEVREIAKDGNCLFRAVADQLRHHFGIAFRGQPALHTVLRRVAANHIISNVGLYKPFTNAQSLRAVEDMIAKLEQAGEWAGEEALMALSRALQVTIVVIQAHAPDNVRVYKPVRYHASPHRTHVVYLHYVNRSHYESLQRAGAGNCAQPAKDIKRYIENVPADTFFVPDASAVASMTGLIASTSQAMERERREEKTRDYSNRASNAAWSSTSSAGATTQARPAKRPRPAANNIPNTPAPDPLATLADQVERLRLEHHNSSEAHTKELGKLWKAMEGGKVEIKALKEALQKLTSDFKGEAYQAQRTSFSNILQRCVPDFSVVSSTNNQVISKAHAQALHDYRKALLERIEVDYNNGIRNEKRGAEREEAMREEVQDGALASAQEECEEAIKAYQKAHDFFEKALRDVPPFLRVVDEGLKQIKDHLEATNEQLATLASHLKELKATQERQRLTSSPPLTFSRN